MISNFKAKINTEYPNFVLLGLFQENLPLSCLKNPRTLGTEHRVYDKFGPVRVFPRD